MNGSPDLNFVKRHTFWGICKNLLKNVFNHLTCQKTVLEHLKSGYIYLGSSGQGSGAVWLWCTNFIYCLCLDELCAIYTWKTCSFFFPSIFVIRWLDESVAFSIIVIWGIWFAFFIEFNVTRVNLKPWKWNIQMYNWNVMLLMNAPSCWRPKWLAWKRR